MIEPVTVERVRFEDYVVLLRRVADWIDQTVRVGTDEAEQLRSAASMMANLALASAARETASIDDACWITGVSRRTIYNWINAGKVEFVRTPGGAVRIYTDTLLKPPDRMRP